MFIVSTLAILVVPGPSVMFVVARTMEQGRSAGLMGMAGIETGALVHVAVASAGLSALVASSPEALALLRWIGGAYLLWLGTQAIRRHRRGGPPPVPASSSRLFRQGMLVDLLNPEDGVVLTRLPARLRRPRARAGGRAGRFARCLLRRAGDTDRRRLRLGGRTAEPAGPAGGDWLTRAPGPMGCSACSRWRVACSAGMIRPCTR